MDLVRSLSLVFVDQNYRTSWHIANWIEWYHTCIQKYCKVGFEDILIPMSNFFLISDHEENFLKILLKVTDVESQCHNCFFNLNITAEFRLNSRITIVWIALAIRTKSRANIVRHANWPCSVHLCFHCKRNYGIHF